MSTPPRASLAAALALASCAADPSPAAPAAPPAPVAPVAPAALGPAELVIEHARIWSDGREGFAEFAAVSGGRFVHVGDPDGRWIGPGTERLDAQGRVVIPGLIDAHVHMLGGGRSLAALQLRGAADRADFVARVDAWARSLPEGAWILGGRWSTESWPDPAPPTRAWVDAASHGHPLLLQRMDGHSALANSAALALAGITRAGPDDPAGGVIDRDPVTREPTGILRESAVALVSRLVPPRTVEQDLAALDAAMGEANRHGITAVGDIPDAGDLPVYERLAEREPSLRFFLYASDADWTDAAPRARAFRGRLGWIEMRGLKMYLDGSLGSRTAYMHAPFQDDPLGREGWRGLLREGIAEGQLARNLAVARAAGLQPIAHAIGDAANGLLLDELERAYAELGPARARSEHAQHLAPADIARFGRLGVIASMQPYHKADDGRYAESVLGEQRCRSSYAFRSLLAAGAVVAFGSDWPVVPIDPFLGIAAAVTGRTLDGVPWQVQESISAEEALRCATSRAAYALGAEGEIGRIAPGMRADFVVLSTSPFDERVQWAAIRPVEVRIGGRRVAAD